jgi:hypothetical protein
MPACNVTKEFHEFYQAVAKQVLTYRNNRKSLAEILLKSIPPEDPKSNITLTDRTTTNKKEIAYDFIKNPVLISPFSFFMFFNDYIGTKEHTIWPRWNAWTQSLITELSLAPAIKSPQRQDLPYRVHPHSRAHYFEVMDGWLQMYRELGNGNLPDVLWNVADYATNNPPPDPAQAKTNANINSFIKDFNSAQSKLRIVNAALLCGGLNWLNPWNWPRVGGNEMNACGGNYQGYYDKYCK